MPQEVQAPLILEKYCNDCFHYSVCGYIHPLNKFLKTQDKLLTSALDPTKIEQYIKGLANACLSYTLRIDKPKKKG